MSARARPDSGEMEMAMHVANGLFKALDWINSGLLDETVTVEEQRHVRCELIIAGRMLTQRICDDF